MVIKWNNKIEERLRLYCVSFIPCRDLQFVVLTTSESEAIKLTYETFQKNYGDIYTNYTFDDFSEMSAAEEINMDFLVEIINRSVVDIYDKGNKVIALEVDW